MGPASDTDTDGHGYGHRDIETQTHIATDPSWGHMNPTHRPTQSRTDRDRYKHSLWTHTRQAWTGPNERPFGGQTPRDRNTDPHTQIQTDTQRQPDPNKHTHRYSAPQIHIRSSRMWLCNNVNVKCH